MTRTLSGALTIAFCVLATLALSQPEPAPLQARPMDLPAAIDRVRSSVVQLRYVLTNPLHADEKLVAMGPLGTGFLVGDGYVITAVHVIDAFWKIGHNYQHRSVRIGVQLPATFPDAPITFRGSFIDFQFDIVDEDARHDLALLKARDWPPGGRIYEGINLRGEPMTFTVHGAVFSHVARPREGQNIAVSGYPLGKNVLVTTTGTIASAWDWNEELVPLNGVEGAMVPDMADSYLADVRVNVGNSGGPVYSVEDGAVLGVCIAYVRSPVHYGDESNQDSVEVSGRSIYDNSGIAAVVPIRYVIALLERNGARWASIR